MPAAGRLWGSALLHDMDDAPFWYWDVVMRELYRPDRVVSEEEIKAAIAYRERHGMPVNERSLSRLLGVNLVFRKECLRFFAVPHESMRQKFGI